jgi:hypothetical protein
VFAVGLLFGRSASVKLNELQTVQQTTEPMKAQEQRFKNAYQDLEDTKARLEKLESWAEARYYWADVCSELQRLLVQVEQEGRRKFRVEVGLWIEELSSLEAGAGQGLFGDRMSRYGAAGSMGMPGGELGGMAPDMPGYGGPPGAGYPGGAPGAGYPGGAPMYGEGVNLPAGEAPINPVTGLPMGAGGMPPPVVEGGGAMPAINPNTGLPMVGAGAGQPMTDPMTGEPLIDPNTGMPMMAPGDTAAGRGTRLTLICRAVSLTAIDSGANTALAFALEGALRSSELFDPQATSLQGQIGADEPDGTYAFGVNLVLKHPLEL